MLVPGPGMNTHPALEVRSLNHWTTKGSWACPLKCHSHTRHSWSLQSVLLPLLGLLAGTSCLEAKTDEEATVWPFCVASSSGNQQFHPLVCFVFILAVEREFSHLTISRPSHIRPGSHPACCLLPSFSPGGQTAERMLFPSLRLPLSWSGPPRVRAAVGQQRHHGCRAVSEPHSNQLASNYIFSLRWVF